MELSELVERGTVFTVEHRSGGHESRNHDKGVVVGTPLDVVNGSMRAVHSTEIISLSVEILQCVLSIVGISGFIVERSALNKRSLAIR